MSGRYDQSVYHSLSLDGGGTGGHAGGGVSFPPIATAINAAAMGGHARTSSGGGGGGAGSGSAAASAAASSGVSGGGVPQTQADLLASFGSTFGTGAGTGSGSATDPGVLSMQKFADLAVQNLAGTFVSLLHAFAKQTNRTAYIETRVQSALTSASAAEDKVSDMEKELKRERDRATERIIALRKDIAYDTHALRKEQELGSSRMAAGFAGVDRDFQSQHARMRALELRLARCEAIQGLPVDESTLTDLMGLASGTTTAQPLTATAQSGAATLPPKSAVPPPQTAFPVAGATAADSHLFPHPEPTSRQMTEAAAVVLQSVRTPAPAADAAQPATAAETKAVESVGGAADKPKSGAADTGAAAPPAAVDEVKRSAAFPAAAKFAAAFVASNPTAAATNAAAAATVVPGATSPPAAATPAAAAAAVSVTSPSLSGAASGPSPTAATTKINLPGATPLPGSPRGSLITNSKPTGTSATKDELKAAADGKADGKTDGKVVAVSALPVAVPAPVPPPAAPTAASAAAAALLRQFQALSTGAQKPGGSAGGVVATPAVAGPAGAMTLSNLGTVMAVAHASFNTRMEYHERVLANLESTLRAVLGNLEEIVGRLNADASEKKRADDALTNTIEHVQELSTAFSAQRQVLEAQIKGYRADFDKALEHKLALIESAVGKELDHMAVNKASKQDLDKVNERLLLVTEKTVEREEYSRALNDISTAMADTIEERRRHIREIANQLQVLVQAVASKASKSDLIDVASVLNAFPQVALELTQLKEFVSVTISEKTDRIAENSVDRRQLRASLNALVRKLKNEVQALVAPAGPHQCETCAVRLGTHSGPTCLSCSAKLKLIAGAEQQNALNTPPGAASNPAGDREFVASRGGGFSLAVPRRTGLAPDAGAMLGIGSMFGVAVNTHTASSSAAAGALAAAGPHSSGLNAGAIVPASAGGAPPSPPSARRRAAAANAVPPGVSGTSKAAALKAGQGVVLVPTAVSGGLGRPGDTLQLVPQPPSDGTLAPAATLVAIASADALPAADGGVDTGDDSAGEDGDSTAAAVAAVADAAAGKTTHSVTHTSTDVKVHGTAMRVTGVLGAVPAAAGSGPDAKIEVLPSSGTTLAPAAIEPPAPVIIPLVPSAASTAAVATSTATGAAATVVVASAGVRLEPGSDGRLYPMNGAGRTHRMVIAPRGKPRTYKRIMEPNAGAGGLPPVAGATGSTDEQKSVAAAAAAVVTAKPPSRAGGAASGGAGKTPAKPAAAAPTRPWDN